MLIQRGLDLKPTKLEHICSCHNFFPPFFCANTFDTSLLLIVCALKWYTKSLYRHLFLEDVSKNARVTQKWHFLICGKLYSQARGKFPWSASSQLYLRGGGFTRRKKSESIRSQLRALAIRTQSLGRCGHGAWL